MADVVALSSPISRSATWRSTVSHKKAHTACSDSRFAKCSIVETLDGAAKLASHYEKLLDPGHLLHLLAFEPHAFSEELIVVRPMPVIVHGEIGVEGCKTIQVATLGVGHCSIVSVCEGLGLPARNVAESIPYVSDFGAVVPGVMIGCWSVVVVTESALSWSCMISSAWCTRPSMEVPVDSSHTDAGEDFGRSRSLW